MFVYNVNTYIHERDWPVIFQSHKVIGRFCYLCYYSIFLYFSERVCVIIINKCSNYYTVIYLLLHINYYRNYV